MYRLYKIDLMEVSEAFGEKATTINMEIKPVDQNLVHVFSGDKITIRRYLNECEYLIEEFFKPNSNDTRMARRLLIIFMGKLDRRAREQHRTYTRKTTIYTKFVAEYMYIKCRRRVKVIEGNDKQTDLVLQY